MSFSQEVVWREAADPVTLDAKYNPPQTETKILKAGWSLTPDYAPFRSDTVWDKDVVLTLRDGCKIRADIFRPNHQEPVPALIAWSPYGQDGQPQRRTLLINRFVGFNPLEIIPGRVGVPKNRLSGFEKFEAPDPAEWTSYGYAIVNPDTRGTCDSEGDILHFGRAEGRDGYDVVEEIAGLDWCDGSVGLIGNSWLGIAQWFIAAEQPPHLKCIAPLEGASDFYREILCRGGIPQVTFWDFLSDQLRGRNRQEDVVGMLKKYPLMNEYWSDKRANISRINIPAYVLASYSTSLHTFGSFRGFEEIPHDKKWLRVHPTQEWHDLYQESTNEELRKFFDRYIKNQDNDWEGTPHVRASLIRYNKEPIVNRLFSAWPIPEAKDKTLYLTSEQEMSLSLAEKSSVLQYKSDEPFLQMDADKEEISFTHTFEEPTAILGCARAVLYLSTIDSNDMDVFVQIRKASSSGEVLQYINIPEHDRNHCNMPNPVEPINPLIYLGPSGCLRASHRAPDTQLSRTWWPEHDYSKSEPLKSGEVVKLEIGLWQTGIQFEKGEKLILKVAGHSMTLAEFPGLRGQIPNENRGMHRIHVGGEYSSQLLIPTYIPERFAKWKRRATEVREGQQKLYLGLLREAKERISKGKDVNCFMDLLLSEPEMKKHQLDDLHLAYVGGVMMEAGSDSTSSTLLSFILAMMKYPEILKKAQAEVDRVCGSERSPTFEDVPNLPYIKACVYETMRWRPAVPAAFPHVLTQDDWYNGYLLPKGSLVIANVHAVHRNEDDYNNPAAYWPDRYLDNELGVEKSKEAENNKARRAVYTFGAGRRICPGQHLGENSLKVNMAKLAWGFNFLPPLDPVTNEPISLDDIVVDIESAYTDGVSSGPKPYRCRIVPRSGKHADIMREDFEKSLEMLSQYS